MCSSMLSPFGWLRDREALGYLPNSHSHSDRQVELSVQTTFEITTGMRNQTKMITRMSLHMLFDESSEVYAQIRQMQRPKIRRSEIRNGTIRRMIYQPPRRGLPGSHKKLSSTIYLFRANVAGG